MISTGAAIALIAMAVLAAIWDGRQRRIPNGLIAAMVVTGTAWNAVALGWQGVLQSGRGMVVGAGLLLIFYILGGIEAGDVKFLAAVGAFIGALNTIVVFVLASVVAGIMATVAFVRSRSSQGPVTIPYGVALSGATIVIAGLKVIG